MAALLAVFLGGALGSVLRHLASLGVRAVAGDALPWGTLVVNVAGSFVLALVATLAVDDTRLSPALRLALTTGFCGGFTTYSTFNLELLAFLQRGLYLRSALYLAATLGACLVGGALGLVLGQRLRGGGA